MEQAAVSRSKTQGRNRVGRVKIFRVDRNSRTDGEDGMQWLPRRWGRRDCCFCEGWLSTVGGEMQVARKEASKARGRKEPKKFETKPGLGTDRSNQAKRRRRVGDSLVGPVQKRMG